jgi:excisionase family DNA binding protein
MNSEKNTGTQEHKDSRKEEFNALTVNARQAAKMLNVSVRQVWRLCNTGKLPKPIRLGHCVRWRKAELEAFIEAGAPTREQWECRTTNGHE